MPVEPASRETRRPCLCQSRRRSTIAGRAPLDKDERGDEHGSGSAVAENDRRGPADRLGRREGVKHARPRAAGDVDRPAGIGAGRRRRDPRAGHGERGKDGVARRAPAPSPWPRRRSPSWRRCRRSAALRGPSLSPPITSASSPAPSARRRLPAGRGCHQHGAAPRRPAGNGGCDEPAELDHEGPPLPEPTHHPPERKEVAEGQRRGRDDPRATRVAEAGNRLGGGKGDGHDGIVELGRQLDDTDDQYGEMANGRERAVSSAPSGRGERGRPARIGGGARRMFVVSGSGEPIRLRRPGPRPPHRRPRAGAAGNRGRSRRARSPRPRPRAR